MPTADSVQERRVTILPNVAWLTDLESRAPTHPPMQARARAHSHTHTHTHTHIHRYTHVRAYTHDSTLSRMLTSALASSSARTHSSCPAQRNGGGGEGGKEDIPVNNHMSLSASPTPQPQRHALTQDGQQQKRNAKTPRSIREEEGRRSSLIVAKPYEGNPPSRPPYKVLAMTSRAVAVEGSGRFSS